MGGKTESAPGGLLIIRDAADLLGVSLPMLRRTDESGKFKARRHPINRYRLDAKAGVLTLRTKIVE